MVRLLFILGQVVCRMNYCFQCKFVDRIPSGSLVCKRNSCGYPVVIWVVYGIAVICWCVPVLVVMITVMVKLIGCGGKSD